ncbi:hypothetical protein RND81_10G239600 [Saponaria officinalis]|uniref:Peptidase C1A papain C-terminal domain-containing protein n=1 Tax=Saponaria officinalis TaxID=3572 RepID=A0AAW1I763_SAPOF
MDDDMFKFTYQRRKRGKSIKQQTEDDEKAKTEAEESKKSAIAEVEVELDDEMFKFTYQRRKKGKAPMTVAQLEEEERAKREADEENERWKGFEERIREEEERRSGVHETQLSRVIERLLISEGADIPGPSEEFSWKNVGSYGISSWPIDFSPLPKAQNQGRLGRCIPYSVFHLMQMQAAIMAIDRGVPIPNISLFCLLDKFESLPKRERTLGIFLGDLCKNNFARSETYSKTQEMLIQRAKYEFGIDWSYGIEPEGLDSKLFEEFMKYAIRNFGGVLLEYKVRETTGEGERSTVKVPLQKEKKKTGSKSREVAAIVDDNPDLGHVVVAFGFRPSEDEEDDYFILNSYGSEYGDEGCTSLKEIEVKLSDIHYIYVGQLRFL